MRRLAAFLAVVLLAGCVAHRQVAQKDIPVVHLPSSSVAGQVTPAQDAAQASSAPSSSGPMIIRVALLRKQKGVTLSADEPFHATAMTTDLPARFKAGSRLVIGVKGDHLIANGHAVKGDLEVATENAAGALKIASHPYRGSLLIRPLGHGSFNVIELVDIEAYLYGVLSREVGEEWPMESLKAQAVVSRTFVLANPNKNKKEGYDVTNDVFSQVYGGKSAERATTTAAVDATRGQILVDKDGKPIQAFFHSSCGGYTEAPEYVWRDIPHAYPYLVTVRDSYCKDDPYLNWSRSIRTAVLEQKLRKAGYRVGEITKLKTVRFSPSGRAASIAVFSGRKSVELSSNHFRLIVGADTLRSTLLTKMKVSGGKVYFEGHGWGHGVGLCQYGARGRARAGQTYQDIVLFYYPNTHLAALAR